MPSNPSSPSIPTSLAPQVRRAPGAVDGPVVVRILQTYLNHVSAGERLARLLEDAPRGGRVPRARPLPVPAKQKTAAQVAVRPLGSAVDARLEPPLAANDPRTEIAARTP